MSEDELSRTVVASALAGLVSRVCLHPIDTIKSRIQVAPTSPKLSLVLSTPGLYRGFAVAAAGSIPGVTLYFTSFQFFRNSLSAAASLPPAISDFAAGFLAEAVSCAFWVPVDVCKERLQVSSSANVRDISRSLGVRGLYRGYWATLASYGPFSALYFLFAEDFKRRSPNPQNSILHSVLLCGSAGSLASFLTTPLDLVKLRLQVPNFQYANFRSGLVHVARHEGLAGLFRGASPRVAFSALNTALTMGSMEYFRSRLSQ